MVQFQRRWITFESIFVTLEIKQAHGHQDGRSSLDQELETNFRDWIVLFGVFECYEANGIGFKTIGSIQVLVIRHLTLNTKRAYLVEAGPWRCIPGGVNSVIIHYVMCMLCFIYLHFICFMWFFNRQLTWPFKEKFLISPLNEGILLYWARNILNLYCCIQAMIHSDESMRRLIQLVILVYLI